MTLKIRRQLTKGLRTGRVTSSVLEGPSHRQGYELLWDQHELKSAGRHEFREEKCRVDMNFVKKSGRVTGYSFHGYKILYYNSFINLICIIIQFKT